MLPTYWWIIATVVSIVAIYYFWARKLFSKEQPKQ
jgi:hypothetical protein